MFGSPIESTVMLTSAFINAMSSIALWVDPATVHQPGAPADEPDREVLVADVGAVLLERPHGDERRHAGDERDHALEREPGGDAGQVGLGDRRRRRSGPGNACANGAIGSPTSAVSPHTLGCSSASVEQRAPHHAAARDLVAVHEVAHEVASAPGGEFGGECGVDLGDAGFSICSVVRLPACHFTLPSMNDTPLPFTV